MINEIRTLGTTLALVVALTSCSGSETGPNVEGGQQNNAPGASAQAAPEPQCSSDADCPDGTGCAPSAGACVAFAQEGQVFSVLVNPIGDHDLLPYQYSGVTVGAGGRIDLAVDVPVEVKGVVVFGQEGNVAATDPSGNPQALSMSDSVGGYLVATAEGLIPGTQLRSEAPVGSMQARDQDWTYTLALLPEVTYEMTFIPDFTSDELPDLPLHSVSARFSKSGRFDIVLPSKMAYLEAKLTGVVLLDEENSTPVEGARVSGRLDDGSKGTTDVTDDKGVFTIVLPPGKGPVYLHVESVSEPPEFPARDFYYQDGISELAAQATPRFVVGPVPAQRNIILQVVNVMGGNLVPVSQARVEARGVAAEGQASGQGTSGSDGLVHLKLLEGLYALTVMPPSGSGFASKQMVLNLESKKEDTVFVVPLGQRSKITGSVVREGSGEGVPGATITLQTNQVLAFIGAEQGVQDFSVDALTGPDGTFEVFVDPGLYALTVVPPAWSGLARFSQPSVDLSEGDSSLKVSLPPGALVRGGITRATDGSVIAGARVQFYFNAPEEKVAGFWALDETSFAASIQLAGSASVDMQGGFSMVVPTLAEGEYGMGTTPGTGTWNDGSDASEAKSAYGLPAVDVDPAQADSR